MRFSVSPGILSLPNFPLHSEEQILREYNLQRLIKMASNENCYGPSPKVLQALSETASRSHRYPEVFGAPLKNKLAGTLNLEPSQIVLGNGSTELVELIARTFLQPRDNCLTAHETFPIYRIAAQRANGICNTVPLRNDHYDLEGLALKITPETRVIFIANPNNPTGTALKHVDLQSFLDRVPANVLVIIDEAYREYVPGYVNSIGDIAKHPNLIVLHTFSKVYGLAGLRMGYAVCSTEVASYLQRAALPYDLNVMAQIAATVALDDQNHVSDCVSRNAGQRDRMQKEFAARGLTFVPSLTNFVLLRVPDPASFYDKLLRKGILIAKVPQFNIQDAVRITLGTPEENQALLDALDA